MAFCLASAHAAAAQAADLADTVFVGGAVKTPSGWAAAAAVRAGVIVAVGQDSDVRPLVGPSTRVVALNGDALLPGLHDSHVHPLFAGLAQYDCRLPSGGGATAVKATLRACVAAARPGDWIVGGSWVAAAFRPGEQNRKLLDEVAPNNPVLLNDEALHSVWVNSAALRLAGVDRRTPDPQGGVIEHDAAGEPNGLLRENATRLAENVVPPASLGLRRKALTLVANQMLSYGVTSVTIASVRWPDVVPLSQLSGEGLIKQRMRGCIVWAPGPPEVRGMGDDLIARRAEFARPRFALDCVKLFLDGVPTESHTGAMLEPYADSPHEGPDERPAKGILQIPQDELNAAVSRFDEAGLSVKFHAAGDGAVRAAIDAVAAARRANGYGGPFHAVAHATFVAIGDIPRARDLELAWEFSPYIWYPTPMAASDVAKAVGPERMKRWAPVREALDTGALVVAGSDWPVVPSVNPWLGLETMVTRRNPGGGGAALGGAEAVSLEEAFKVFTLNGARLMGQSDKVGSIEVGKHADLIVTAGNPFTSPVTALHDTRVKMTFIDGELVFDAAHPPVLEAR